jgi:hypothetical protein
LFCVLSYWESKGQEEEEVYKEKEITIQRKREV